MNTDTTALAAEALDHEGADAYHGATVEQLAEFLDANPDLWEPATEDSAWQTLDMFDGQLRKHLGVTIDLDHIDARAWAPSSGTERFYGLDRAADELVALNPGDWVDDVGLTEDDIVDDVNQRNHLIDWVGSQIAERIRRLAADGRTWATLDELADEMNATRFDAETGEAI